MMQYALAARENNHGKFFDRVSDDGDSYVIDGVSVVLDKTLAQRAEGLVTCGWNFWAAIWRSERAKLLAETEQPQHTLSGVSTLGALGPRASRELPGYQRPMRDTKQDGPNAALLNAIEVFEPGWISVGERGRGVPRGNAQMFINPYKPEYCKSTDSLTLKEMHEKVGLFLQE